ncbi:TonB-dependent Receptor Plug Domain [Flavobacterium sp. CF108]|uniref:TonB-dependent receptor n=1 Tax=unclassified Flavobacterium TaxID=196869 RepID=UPI0008CEE5E9|nr:MULTISPECIES: TonB-dependent receptor [unclassified Flavobacterium]SEO16813.1 TonB-dependent Receptor Plug Domain [Flavobacterium sp. fv08]SHG56279.1 TonB-dependent Receptor Plug Domain [Flavobacterium sp. CF108]
MKHIISACFFLFSWGVFSQNVTVTVDQTVTLKEFFKQIENQSDFKFAFTDQINTSQRYFTQKSVYNNIEIKQLINELNKNTSIQFSIVGSNIFVKQKAVKTAKKKNKLTGQVLDENKEPVIGANVFIIELSTGVTTDINGTFSIDLDRGIYNLVVSYVGLKNKERQIAVDSDERIKFNMESDSQELEQVIVTNSKAVDVRNTQMSVNKLSMAEIKRIPVAMGEPDPLKSLLTLPGVTNAGEASSGFNVRGGAADQNLILLDGAPVYGDSHMFGFFSIFNADVVNGLDLYKGGIPSKFGGRVSSVLDVTQQTGDFENYKVNGGIGLISSRLLVQGPIKKDVGSFLIAGRASYAHLFLKLADNNNSAMFYDINAKFNYRLGANNSLAFSGYLGNDVFDINDRFSSTYGNTMGILSWKHKFSENLNTNLAVFYSDYKFNLGLQQEDFDWNNNIRTYGLKYGWNHIVTDKFKLNYGIDGQYYNFNPGTVQPTSLDSDFNYKQLDKKYSLETSAYLDFENQITPKLNLRYGLRYSLFYRLGNETINTYQDGKAVVFNPLYHIYQEGTPTGSITYGKGDKISSFDNLEPRVALSYAFSDDASVKASYNRMAQYIHILSNTQSPLPTSIWTPSGPFTKPQLLDQYAAGYFRNFKDGDYSFEGELFYKKIQNRIDYIDGADILANNNIEQVILNGKARSYGMELSFRKNTGNFTGWVSYTLSRAEQKTPGRTPDEPGIANGDWYLSGYDKLHNLNIVGSYEYNPKWSFNANFTLQSGQPVTYANGYYEFGGINIPNFSLRNENRLPLFHHLDLAATYTPKPDKKKGWQSYWVFSLYNVYNRKNAASMTFATNEDTGANETRRLSIFGVVPGISYNFKF